MKVLLVLVALAAAGYAVFHFTGAFDFNPAQQAADFKAKVTPGMSWDKVIAVHEPRRYCIYVKKVTEFGGEKIETWDAGPEVPFDRDALAARIDEGSLGGGFSFMYFFDAGNAFEVKFDSNGDVEGIYKQRTVKDLLDM